jgi:hypothetical protein
MEQRVTAPLAFSAAQLAADVASHVERARSGASHVPRPTAQSSETFDFFF